jgi:hypothetical protein
VNVTPKRPRPSMPKFDLYALPDHQWTAKKRRSVFRRRRVEHLAALESEQAEDDRRRVALGADLRAGDGALRLQGT